MSEKTKVNIKCPMCETPIAAIFKGHDVKGVLQHKCSKCKRSWNVDYTSQEVVWAHGKGAATPIKKFTLDFSTGCSTPLTYINTKEALLRRKGA